ncbi:MAG: lysophospholipid acyltransferase family protein [Thermodesulfobacteriota bacterium]
MAPVVIKLLRRLLFLRYRVEVQGLDRIAGPDGRGILFLANHPALIDPPLVLATLYRLFRPRPLADEDQVNLPLIRRFMGVLGVITIPSIGRKGRHSRAGVVKGLERVVKALERGDEVLLYPAGRLYRSRYESLQGNSGVATILAQVTDARVVLVRTTGLWGSSFSRSAGPAPHLLAQAKTNLWRLMVNGIFFGPRRCLAMEFSEPADLPRQGGRHDINRYLESYYNQEAPAPSAVPYYWWQGR